MIFQNILKNPYGEKYLKDLKDFYKTKLMHYQEIILEDIIKELKINDNNTNNNEE